MVNMNKNLKEILLGTDPARELREMVADDSLSALEPTLAELKMDIPNGFHHKDNLEHSIRVLENAMARETSGTDLILRTAALFHDVGKPATRKFGARKSVTFDGHEYEGAKIVKKVLPSHGFTKTEIKEIALLVGLHMRSHGFADVDWTDTAVRRLITDAGNEETLDRLVIIFYSDATSKRPDTLRKVHNGVDGLKREIERVLREDARKALRPAINGNEAMALFDLIPGKELGQVMKFLNSDEGVILTREQAITAINVKFDFTAVV